MLRRLGEPTPRPLDVQASGGGAYTVRDGGSEFTVTVQTTEGPDRPESCGKAGVPSSWFTATVDAAAG